ncbi:MAG: M3 family metallopeptidase [Verrucomicrobiota bacterium]
MNAPMHTPFLDSTFFIEWSKLRPEFIVPDITQGIQNAEGALQQIRAQSLGSVTYASSILAIEEATRPLSVAWNKVQHLDSVQNSKALREANNQMLPKVSEFFSKIPLDAQLWAVVKAFSETEEASQLEGVHLRLFEETLADFKENGAALSDADKAKIGKIDSELAAKTQKFSENVLDATNAWVYYTSDVSELAGLPDAALEAAKQDAVKKGRGTEEAPAYRFTLQMPSLLPILKYADNREFREKVWSASVAVGREGETNNVPLIKEILSLRHQKAKILGREHFADMVLSRRMAKSGSAALRFVENLHERVKSAFESDYSELSAFKSEETGPDEGLHPWDVAYWSEKQRLAQYAFDEEALRPYFSIDHVISGMFDLASQLFDLRIEEIETQYVMDGTVAAEGIAEVWDPEVKLYGVYDAQNDEYLGAFYADWYPRENKRGGAWMNYLYTGITKRDAARTPHLGLICGNMTPSVGDQPALLNHREVETVFHEFGHLLHHICGDVEIPSLNGVNVAWDFVELPSQIMENWCWERESLDKFAVHYETGNPIPEDLFDKMIAAKNFQSASFTMRQLSFGKMDLDLHISYADREIEDLDSLLREILAGYEANLDTPSVNIAPRFTHIFGSSVGYASGYYSYKWAEVLDADAFSKFKEKGILDSDTGRKFRKTVLSKGNSAPPEELFKNFMGRDPNPDALLERAGLL